MRPFQSQEYENDHKEGTKISGFEYRSWMEEVKASGKVFPGRPVVRPRIDFEGTRQEENSRSCNKKYAASTMFGPGIFTVQCCCKFLNVLGVSVMESCKGTFTALSVLLSHFTHLLRCMYYDKACKL